MQTQSYSSKPSEQLTPVEAVQQWLVAQLAEQLNLAPTSVQVSEPLTRYGLDSIDAVTIVGDLEDWLDLELPSTLFWDYPTIQESATYLAANYDLSGIATDAPSAPKSEEDVPAAPAEEKKSGGWGNLWGKLGA